MLRSKNNTCSENAGTMRRIRESDVRKVNDFFAVWSAFFNGEEFSLLE